MLYVIYIRPPKTGGIRYGNWLRHYATNRKVTGSIPNEVIRFFNSSRTMALGSTQPLTDVGTRSLPGGKGRPAIKSSGSVKRDAFLDHLSDYQAEPLLFVFFAPE
jgi:hypothetical protein